MKSDKKRLSICRPGQEEYEGFYVGPTFYLQYDYRSFENRQLFTGVFRSLEDARKARDKWLTAMGVDQ